MKNRPSSRYWWPLLGVLLVSRLLVLLSLLWLTPDLKLLSFSPQQPLTLGVDDLVGRPVVVEARSANGQPRPLTYTFVGCPPVQVSVSALRQYELQPCANLQLPRRVTLASAPEIQIVYAGLTALGAGQGNLLRLLFAGLDTKRLTEVHELFLHELSPGERLLHNAYNWDARWYLSIARFGYFYDDYLAQTRQYSNAAFYPLLPTLGAMLAALSGLPPEVTLLGLVQVLSVASGLLLFQLALVLGRAPSEGFAAVALYALFPTSFFLSIPYTESLYVTLSILVFLGLRTRWGPVAAVLSVLTRSTGVVHGPVLLLQGGGSLRQRLLRGASVGVGLLGFAAWLELKLGEPLAFVNAQDAWRQPLRPGSGLQHLLDAVLLGPIWRLVGRLENWSLDWVSVNLAVALLVLLTLLTCYRRLPRPLRLYTLLALGLPYFTFASSRVEMISFSRFVLAAYPLFLVWGQLLHQRPVLLAGVAALCSILLALSSALFGGGAFLG